MRTITTAELENNFKEYLRLAETEKIEVTKGGNVVFTMLPKRYELAEQLKKYFGILPANAMFGQDPNERG